MAVITGLEPSTIKRYEAATVLIKGSGFKQATRTTKVYLEDYPTQIPVKSFTIDSDTQITAVIPAYQYGSTYVIVEIDGKQSTTPTRKGVVGDGDGLSATGTIGVTVTDIYTNANKLFFLDPSMMVLPREPTNMLDLLEKDREERWKSILEALDSAARE